MEITKQEQIEQLELKRQKKAAKSRKMALIAGILAIISIALPFAFATRCIEYDIYQACLATNTQLIWQFGISLVLSPLGFEWAWFPIVAIGIFTSAFLALGGILLTVTAVMSKEKEVSKFESYWKACGELILVSPILQIFYLVMRTSTYFEYYIIFIPFIGLIVPIIAGVIAIITGRKVGKM